MTKRHIFMSLSLVIFLGIWIVYENWPIVQSEAKIRREMLQKFPIGTDKSVVHRYVKKTYVKPYYLPGKGQFDYIISEIKGVTAVTVTWEFNNKNQLIEVKVQKDYGP